MDDRPASDTPGAMPSQLSRFDFVMRWSPRDHLAFRAFFNDLAQLIAIEHAIERRRLTTNLDLYAAAVEQTRRELEEHE